MSTMCANSETHHYFIAADDDIWNMAPSGRNLITDTELGLTPNEAVWAKASATRIGHEHKKARYQECTDATFETLKPRPAQCEHLGLSGPLLRAEVGDTIEIRFRNNTSFPASMHPHGVFYDKSSEGAIYEDRTSGKDKADDAVPPGGEHTYIWEVPERAGPFGTPSIIVKGIPDLIANLKETLNGDLYGNLRILELTQGEKVRWYLMSGTNFELHALHWHGNVVDWRGMNTDVAMLGTMDMGVAEMVPDNPGMWLFHCHNAGHFAAGMISRYLVHPAP